MAFRKSKKNKKGFWETKTIENDRIEQTCKYQIENIYSTEQAMVDVLDENYLAITAIVTFVIQMLFFFVAAALKVKTFGKFSFFFSLFLFFYPV